MNKLESEKQDNESTALREPLISSLKSYCNKNKRDHQEQPSGWGYYVQNLYLSLKQ